MRRRRRTRPKRLPFVLAGVAAVALAMITAVASPEPVHREGPGRLGYVLPRTPGSYLGVYATRGQVQYTGVRTFMHATGVAPDLVTYYSAWFEPFRTSFAVTAAEHGAVPLVQIEPRHISMTAIASGKYDAYLSGFAAAISSYHHPVILSFGHEMNAPWYSWGYGHVPAAAFVAAWRHIVTLFRHRGVRNVTWLWTVQTGTPGTGPVRSWWPGGKYVTWVGIDGYYYKPSWAFVSLFGPTIVRVRELTRAPILIAETAAAPAAGQAAKIANLFQGVREYGLLGFVWFNVPGAQDWRISGPAAAAALRKGAQAYGLPAP
ncbi:MAG TPA: glycosyl hydrolase [Streptosporangiaceae bacterium]|nr:glycosyl hydrolase [Streptosporangiaceae bacterium]